MLKQALQLLQTALPKGGVVFFNRLEHQAYAVDASSAIEGSPAVVVYPQTRAEVEAVLNIANTFAIPVVPRGAGTGKTGGSVPMEGSIVLSMEAFTRILKIDVDNHMVVVEPGVVLETLHAAVEALGLFYPPDPASLATCTIGGNVALNAGGPRCMKYGVTGQYVAGLEGVWANGAPFSLGGKLYKNVTGYDLMRLLIGSEGTLGVITKITLKLLDKPKFQADCLAFFKTVDSAINALCEIRKNGILPAAAELMDSLCIQAASQYLGVDVPHPEAIHVIFKVDGHHKDSIKNESEIIEACCLQAGAFECKTSQEENKELWVIRRSISSALSEMSVDKESHDITVPVSKLSQTMDFLKSLNTDPMCQVLGYGHLGDGNLHVNILNKGLAPLQWEKVKTKLEFKLFQFAVDIGGTISGEHGIGLTKKRYMSLMYSAEHMLFLKQIKAVFDPNGILNPHKIMD